MKGTTRLLALCGVLTALGVVLLCLGGIVPFALYICPILASIALLPVRSRPRYAWCCYGAIALLGLLLCPDKEVSLLFCFTGYYNGCEKTLFVMIQGIIGAFFVRIPVAYLMSRMAGATLFQIGLSTPASSVVQILLCLSMFLFLARRSAGQSHASLKGSADP